MEAEQDGQPTQARRDRGGKVKDQFPEEAKLPFALKEDVLAKARWGWLADKRLADIEKAGSELGEAAEEDRRQPPQRAAVHGRSGDPDGLAIRGAAARGLRRHGRRRHRSGDRSPTRPRRNPTSASWYLLALQQAATIEHG